jgi:hypothetical protein
VSVSKRPTYGVMPYEERRNISVTMYCHACGKSRTCTDYDGIWGDCDCGRRRWGTWPKGEQSKEGDFTVAPIEIKFL